MTGIATQMKAAFTIHTEESPSHSCDTVMYDPLINLAWVAMMFVI